MDKRFKAIIRKYGLTRRNYKPIMRKYRRMKEWEKMQLFADVIVKGISIGQALRESHTKVHYLLTNTPEYRLYDKQFAQHNKKIKDPETNGYLYVDMTDGSWFYI